MNECIKSDCGIHDDYPEIEPKSIHVPKANLKGDWRALPRNDFVNIHTKFPASPLNMAPEEYVQKRWPTYRELLNAARHLATVWLFRYASSRRLPIRLFRRTQ